MAAEGGILQPAPLDHSLVSDGTLFVVATPLAISPISRNRAEQVLASVDVVPRRTLRRARTLLGAAGAHSRVLSFHATLHRAVRARS